jgi:hypothetical protein
MSFAGLIRESLSPFTGTARTVLIEILVNCNYFDNPNCIFNNKKQPLVRGQWISSQKRLSELTGLTRQQIRTAQSNLENLTILTTKNLTNHATIYTIDNIDKFLINEKDQPTNQPTDQPTGNQRVTITNKEDNKKEKKVSKYIYTPEFEIFWKKYGAIGTKSDAAKIFNGIKEEEYGKLYKGLENYQAYARANDWYHPQHASTWLGNRGWESEWHHQERNDNQKGKIHGNDKDIRTKEAIIRGLTNPARY